MQLTKGKEEEDINENLDKTTISLFLEYLEFSLKNCLEKKILSNTMKVKIVVEVAFGISYIHKLGMIHHDLKLENVMLNSGMEPKIIDFDLVRVSENMMGDSFGPLTKGVGTLAYMSPEMQNEDDYGIFL